ncbi:MAG: hypothetical protein HYY06_31950 [Deltaproteobacteria bacterium]|nr:hypothetical protein [Deltaproteobacteria bacterium]
MSRPRNLIACAAVITAATVASRLAGLARHTSVLSGTLPDGAAGLATSELLCALHLFLHFASVVVAPILVLAALLQWALVRALSGPGERRRDRPIQG